MKKLTALLTLWICVSCWARGQEPPKRTLLFAFFANGTLPGGDAFPTFPLGLQTDLTLTNPGQRLARVTIRFISGAGTEVTVPLVRTGSFPVPTMSENSFDLPARSSTVVSTVPGTAMLTGWVRIESTEPVAALEAVNRVLVSTQFPGTIRPTISEVFLAPATPARSFAVTVTENQLLGSGVAVAVPATAKPLASGILSLWDTEGRAVASRAVTIRPPEQLSILAAELFPGLTGGTIIGEFDEAVIVSSITYGRTVRTVSMGENLVSGIPVD